MGVKKLTSFNEKEIGQKSVDLRAKIRNFKSTASWRQDTPRHKVVPILVFDAQSLMRLLPDSDSMPEYDNVFGGRAWLCEESLEKLLSELTECGAELVFFFDGSWSVETCMKKRAEIDEKYSKRLKVMQEIEEGKHTVLTVLDENLVGFNFGYNSTLLSVVRSVCKKFGEVIICEKNECDQEIANFVQKNQRVLGVIADDSDFLIFPGNFSYFSTSSIVYREKHKKLKIIENQREELRNKLRLNDLQLAVFATFCGNDWMPYDVIGPFHWKISNVKNALPGGFGCMYAIADIVRDNFQLSTVNLDELWTMFQAILIELSGYDVKLLKVLFSESFEKAFQTSIQFYLLNANLDSSSDISDQAFNNQLEYKILYGKTKGILPKFENIFEDSAGNFEELYHLRLSRQYGAILKLNSLTTDDRKLLFFTQLSNHNESQMFDLEPEFPPFDLNKDLNEFEQFQLLKWLSHTEHLPDFDLTIFPDEFIAEILTMSFMFMRNAIKLKELDLILWTVYACKRKLIPRCMVVEGGEPRGQNNNIHLRSMRISHLFVHIQYEVMGSIDICKLRDQFWRAISFDGVFFYSQYQERECDSHPDEKLEIEVDHAEFNEIRDKLHAILREG